MDKYFALDTSGNGLCVVARKGEKKVKKFIPDCAMKHSVTWLKTVEEALEELGLKPEECQFFGAVVGAGSFTGIRIGISAIKGFASAYDKKTLPITSFDTIAYNTIGKDEIEKDTKILCLVDAMHQAYYACGYQFGEVVFPPSYLTEEEVLALEKQGYVLCANQPLEIDKKANLRVFSQAEGLETAVEALSKKDAFGPLFALYVRKSSAELNLGK